MTLSRLNRRRLKAAADASEVMIQADERYFARFPDRSYRVRRASQAEMEANRLAGGLAELLTGPGQRWFCAVKNLAPGVRCRVFLENDADSDTDLAEWQAKIVYDIVATPGSRAWLIEQQLRAALAKRAAAQ